MADITDQTAIDFVNESVRVLADAEATAMFARRRFLADWETVKDLFPVGANPILDGAASDGRTELDADDVINFKARIKDLDDQVVAAGTQAAILKPAVNYTNGE